MANICMNKFKVVSTSEDSLKKFRDIVDGKNEKIYLRRTELYGTEDGPYEEGSAKSGKLFVEILNVGTAWNSESLLGGGKDEERFPESTALEEVCKMLGVGVEIFAEEPECQFQEHIVVNPKGEVVISESVAWSCDYDDDGNVIEEHGGFEDFGEFADAHEIWEATTED